ncbi:peroxisomal membrane protein PEX14-like isoform X2 [Lycium barbarum]|uniref:peroxisomal membrane protein PEX14-like isoform X2 n=1 Tax=Lycium barbarum TaxID=112863 RepID=UPI00293E8A08|nr:peroxisomal membrane protein PEX14-like isoform X2 [Lycium barbarum]
MKFSGRRKKWSLASMDTPSDNPPNSTDDSSQNPATNSQPAAKDNHDSKPEATREDSPTSVFVNSEPVREDQVQNAVKFLSHPNVRGSPVMYRRCFLERKGLTKEEIDEAFRRVPDPTPSVSTTQPITANEDERVKSSSTTQPLTASQNLQPVSALQSNTVRKMGYFSHFHWTHAVMAVGILAASGAGTALLFKHTVIPRLKSWIRKVVMEEEDEEGVVKGRPSLAEEAVVAAKAAAAAAADVARASQAMLASKTEEKRYFEELANLLNHQVREMKSMSSALQKLEGKSSTSGRIPAMEQDDRRIPVSHSRQSYSNGELDVDARSVRSLSPPASVEPSVAPHPKSYIDPWEIGQSQKSSRNFLQSRGSGNGLTYGYQDNLTNGDSSTPWWQRKNARITEIEPENEKKFGSTAAPTEVRPVQRSWVPPQPPPLVKPEAVVAIRQPKKPLFQKEKLTDDELMDRSSEISDDLKRITKISESGGLTEANDSSSGRQLSEAPLTIGSGGLTEANGSSSGQQLSQAQANGSSSGQQLSQAPITNGSGGLTEANGSSSGQQLSEAPITIGSGGLTEANGSSSGQQLSEAPITNGSGGLTEANGSSSGQQLSEAPITNGSGGLTEANGSSSGQQLSEAPITNGDNVLSS